MKIILLIVFFVITITITLSERFYPESTTAIPIPRQWRSQRLGEENPLMRVTIALRHRNTNWLKSMFEQVSDPLSPLYGKHFNFNTINAMVSPHLEHVQSVIDWIHSHGAKIIHITKAKDFIIVEMNTMIAQEMFQCDIHVYQHYDTLQKIYRTENQYSIPIELAPAIAFVGDLTRFPKSFHHHRIHQSNSEINVTPDLIRQYYNITTRYSSVSKNNSQAVASFLEQYYIQSDLEQFQKKFNVTPVPIKIIGPDPQEIPGEEANLDIQYITAIGEGVPTWFVSNIGLHEGQEVFLQWAINMTELGDDCPYVHSVSYGDEESSISIEYAQRVDEEFQKLGLAGRTILFASGDTGAGCNSTSDIDRVFVPNWPATSQYVTTVGGTQAVDNNGEIAWRGSGGGFSNYFTAPKWQQEAIASYLSQDNLPDRRFFNATSRAYPDVSAFAVNYLIVHQGISMQVDGTSASTPTFAGIVSLMNHLRIIAGKAPLGFLNYAIYRHWSKVPGAFRDIRLGRNAYDKCPGFPATIGYDTISGFGSPNAGILFSLANAMP
jgi:tripeptidyl-peptidase-1